MNAHQFRRAAQILDRQHREGSNLIPLTGELAPADLDEAFGVQEALIELCGEQQIDGVPRTLGGWKIALTTPVMQALVGIDHPCPGAILSETIYRSPAIRRADQYVHIAVESEIAVRIGTDAPPGPQPYNRANIGEHVSQCMAAIEIVDDRNWDYDNADARDLVADNSFNFGCVIGEPRSDWRKLDLGAATGRMIINGERVGEGTGADVLGHPFEALAWLANHLPTRNRMLHAGDVVLMGSVVATKWPKPGDRVVAEIDGLEPAVLRVE